MNDLKRRYLWTPDFKNGFDFELYYECYGDDDGALKHVVLNNGSTEKPILYMTETEAVVLAMVILKNFAPGTLR